MANRLSEGFVFTWPVSLFVVHQVVLAAVVWSTRPSQTTLPRWLAPAAALGLIAACAAYYDLCRLLNLAMAWVFLIGFIPSWPLAVPLAYRFGGVRRVFGHVFWAFAVFSLHFWAASGWLWVHNALNR